MKLTSRGELALKAMLELAKAEGAEGTGLSAAEIARRCRASVKFLEQVLIQLRAGGLVISTRGRLGGYRLARNADARASYERALALARQDPERRFLARRISEVS